jgi:murein DD-endopeptidase MepM/ murein hydrolase activator NlpD
MHIIFVGRRSGVPRRLDLTRPLHATLIALILAPPMLVASLIGNQLGLREGAGRASAYVAHWQAQMGEQQSAVAATREQTEAELEALGQQIGTLHAHLIRLDALGERLVEMADLDRGEFDFTQPPAIGGPEDVLPAPVDAVDLLGALTALTALLNDRARQLDVLEHLLLTRKLENRVEPRGEPVDTGWVSSYFGRRNDPFHGRVAHHAGVDFAGRQGSPIKAVADGVVKWSGTRSGYGLLVEVNHGNGLTTRYGHNSKNLVKVGDRIARGETIALMGSTGRSTGPHLHFEVLENGRSRDPMAYIRREE